MLGSSLLISTGVLKRYRREHPVQPGSLLLVFARGLGDHLATNLTQSRALSPKPSQPRYDTASAAFGAVLPEREASSPSECPANPDGRSG